MRTIERGFYPAVVFGKTGAEMGNNGTGTALGSPLTLSFIRRLLARSRGECGVDTIFGIPVLREEALPVVPQRWVSLDRYGRRTGLVFRPR